MPRVQRVKQPLREYAGFKLWQPVFCVDKFNDKQIGTCYIREFRPRTKQVVISKRPQGLLGGSLNITASIDRIRALDADEVRR